MYFFLKGSVLVNIHSGIDNGIKVTFNFSAVRKHYLFDILNNQ